MSRTWRWGKDEAESFGRARLDPADEFRRRAERIRAFEYEEMLHDFDDVTLRCIAQVMLPETYETKTVEVVTSALDPMQVAREKVAQEHGLEPWQIIPVMIERSEEVRDDGPPT